MKTILKIITAISIFFMVTTGVSAATATIGVQTNLSQVVVGNNINVSVVVSSTERLGTWMFKLNYDTSKFQYVSGPDLYLSDGSNLNIKRKTYNYTFKAKSSGSANFNVSEIGVVNYDFSDPKTSSYGKNVKVITKAQLEATYSKVNDLKNLEVTGYDLEPEFSKDTLEYNVTLPPLTEKATIVATKADSRSTVVGAGEKELTLGLNKFEIVVTAQNGGVKTYKLNITVEDLEPIEVKIGSDTYTVVRQKEGLTIPTTFQESTVTIDEKEVPSFINKELDITLVGLKDKDGNISLYQYKDGKYTKHNQLSFTAYHIIPLDYEELDGYTKKEISINKVKVNCFVKEDSDFYIFYGQNLENGSKSLYKYDSVEKTIQRLDEFDSSNIDESFKIATYCFLGSTLLSVVIILYLLNKMKAPKSKSTKKNTKSKKEKKSKKKNLDDTFDFDKEIEKVEVESKDIVEELSKTIETELNIKDLEDNNQDEIIKVSTNTEEIPILIDKKKKKRKKK